MGLAFLQDLDLGLGLFVLAAGVAFSFRQQILQVLEVGQQQFQFDRLHVSDGIDRSGNVDDVRVVKAADHLQDGIDLSDVCQELVAQALAFAGSLHDTGNVDQFEGRRNYFLRRNQRSDPVQPPIGDAHHALVGLDRTERVVGALGCC